MLSRSHRLTKADNVEQILESGGMASNRFLVARFRRNEMKTHRFGVIVSQKIDARASMRNRIRRQLYEIIRLNRERMSAPPHFDILILPKKAIMNASYNEMEDHFLKLFPYLR